ncbi:Fic family protein [Actinomyces sp.]|uniref:Fic family protein n=1 Tax=Actinomyces sp. TaxID=29317 RepID=UPI0034C60DE2
MLSFLSTADRTRAELLSQIGLSNETRNVRRHLEPLLEAGLVERTIPDKPQSRLQRYRITDAGRTYLRNLTGDAE